MVNQCLGADIVTGCDRNTLAPSDHPPAAFAREVGFLGVAALGGERTPGRHGALQLVSPKVG